ncbi:uncharacterized protein LOC119662640 isoform X2 [Teleopsis dalmanni]|uniref:uncharacterized protein LOC119662640 isoform X2 n=1 Tax=Teleopsis dalmanni TaxID=139649 RepID=UPI0018CCAD92|nr:uncharacterized protein LOC119662640 isoform X2 [Teleopsis dalmanni]
MPLPINSGKTMKSQYMASSVEDLEMYNFRRAMTAKWVQSIPKHVSSVEDVEDFDARYEKKYRNRMELPPSLVAAIEKRNTRSVLEGNRDLVSKIKGVFKPPVITKPESETKTKFKISDLTDDDRIRIVERAVLYQNAVIEKVSKAIDDDPHGLVSREFDLFKHKMMHSGDISCSLKSLNPYGIFKEGNFAAKLLYNIMALEERVMRAIKKSAWLTQQMNSTHGVALIPSNAEMIKQIPIAAKMKPSHVPDKKAKFNIFIKQLIRKCGDNKRQANGCDKIKHSESKGKSRKVCTKKPKKLKPKPSGAKPAVDVNKKTKATKKPSSIRKTPKLSEAGRRFLEKNPYIIEIANNMGIQKAIQKQLISRRKTK